MRAKAIEKVRVFLARFRIDKIHQVIQKGEHFTHAVYLGMVSAFAHDAYRYAAMAAFAVVVISGIVSVILILGGGEE